MTVGNYTVTINNDQRYKYPDVGAMSGQKPLYGADSYTDPAAADLLMQRTADHLKWWDNTDQEKEKASEKATWKYRFFSYVKGSAGQRLWLWLCLRHRRRLAGQHRRDHDIHKRWRVQHALHVLILTVA